MAIVRYGEGDGLERRVGMKHSAKKAAKHPAKKHAFKHPGKHAAKKHAEKHAAKHAAKAAKHASKHVGQAELLHEDEHEKDLAQAFHHLQRAVAVVSLLEQESGGDLKLLLENGITLYRKAAAKSGQGIACRVRRQCCEQRSTWGWLVCIRRAASIGWR